MASNHRSSPVPNGKTLDGRLTDDEHSMEPLNGRSGDVMLDNREMEQKAPKQPLIGNQCEACREWVVCCQDLGDEIREKCSQHDCRRCMSKCCSTKKLKDGFPIVKWLPKYRLGHFQGDLIAGLTVGLTVIPQGLAYAKVAELPPQYGLYSAFMGCFVYCLLGTSKDITLGPTAIMSLMTAQFGASLIPGGQDPTVAIILTLFCGIIQFVMGLLNIGFLVEFISYPVINSFTTAAAITIAFGQIKSWLGLQDVPRDFLHQVYYTFKKIPETKIWDFVMGLTVMIILFGMKKMKEIKVRDNSQVSIGARIALKVLWLVGTARNALIVVVAAGVAAILLRFDIDVLSLTGEIKPGLPDFKLPAFSIHTANETYTTLDIFQKIGSGFAIVPIIGLIETIAIGKAFARKNNYIIDANQELIAIGVANILGSFVSSYPVTGSFSRTAVNSQSGVRTPAGGIWTAGLVLLALGVLTPLFKYIPDAALAGVIIMAVLDMASFSMLLKLWRIKRLDLLPWLATFIFSFILGIEYGIMIGVGISALFLLCPWSRPSVRVSKQDVLIGSSLSVNIEGFNQRQVVVAQLNSGLRFPGIEYVKEKVLKEALQDDIPRPVILDCAHVSALDYSTVIGLIGLFEDFRLHNITLVMADMQPEALKTMQNAQSPLFRYCATLEEGIDSIYEEMNEPEEDNPRMGLLSGQPHPVTDSNRSTTNMDVNATESDIKPHQQQNGGSPA